MCFYHGDYDWTASICDETIEKAKKDIECQECWTEIKINEEYQQIFMQESEECLECENEICYCEEDKCCQCEKPDYGETYLHRRCLECVKFLQAIEEVEIAAGCKGEETRPPLEHMLESLSYSDDVNKYFKTALKKFPELKKSGYLKRIYKKVYGAK